jgi:PilZ domain-containing protein
MPQAIRRTTFAEARAKEPEKRRSIRLNSRVPVTIEWDGDEGQMRQETAFTRDVGAHGCLIVLPIEIHVGWEVRVTNLANQRSNKGTVVWRGSKNTDGWELGIELMEPETDFWGLEL